MTAILNDDPPEFAASTVQSLLLSGVAHCGEATCAPLSVTPGYCVRAQFPQGLSTRGLRGGGPQTLVRPAPACLVLLAVLALGVWLRQRIYPELHAPAFRGGRLGARFTDSNAIYGAHGKAAAWSCSPPARQHRITGAGLADHRHSRAVPPGSWQSLLVVMFEGVQCRHAGACAVGRRCPTRRRRWYRVRRLVPGWHLVSCRASDRRKNHARIPRG